jgi:chaperonin GroEL (HSP60 family)
VLGGGKALYNIALAHPDLELEKILKMPLRQICVNAGIKNIPPDSVLNAKGTGVNVLENRTVSLSHWGILDSFKSIDEALKNSGSIACSYLRTNCIIKKETTQSK